MLNLETGPAAFDHYRHSVVSLVSDQGTDLSGGMGFGILEWFNFSFCSFYFYFLYIFFDQGLI